MTDPFSDPQEPLVFPVGHFMGAFHAEVGGALRYRKLRVGMDIRQLTTDQEFGVWALTHGLPDRLDQTAWTRSALLRVAAEMELTDAPTVLDTLITRGVVAEVTPGTDEAVEFARRHRLQPLMTGLGNTPQDPLTFSLGFVGIPPVVKINNFLYELWQWGRIGRSLWQTVEMFAKVEQEVTAKGQGVPDPESALTRILGQLHVLLAHNAAYLDETLPDPTVGA
jgi:hypothetical protein